MLSHTPSFQLRLGNDGLDRGYEGRHIPEQFHIRYGTAPVEDLFF
jgi:hypothetical protein